MSTRLPKIRWWGAALRVGALLAGIFITYLYVMNVLLLTGLVRIAVNRISPDDLHVDYRVAYSPSFLRVHTTGLALRGESDSVQWSITADRANASFGPLDFFSRRVSLHDARARGVTTRIRFKVAPADATRDYVAWLPPIAGFADPPLKAAAAPPPPDEPYRSWTVQVKDVIVDDVREVWVDTVRVSDRDGRAAGSFRLEPGRRFLLGPTDVRTEDATVANGKEVITSNLRGSFALRISDFDVRDVHGVDVLRHVDGKATARSTVGNLHVFDRWLRPSHVAIAGSGGPTWFAVELNHGRIVAGSRAWFRAESWSLWSGHDGVAGTSVVRAVVPDGHPRLAITTETYGLSVHRDEAEVVQAPSVTASVELDNVDLTRPFDRWSASIDVPAAAVKDLRTLDRYLHEPRLLGGSARLRLHADLTPQLASGHAHVDVSGASVTVGKSRVTASGTADATLHALDLHTWKGDLAGARLNLQGVSAAGERGWWINLAANPLSITLEHGLGVSGTVSGKCRDAQLPLAMLGAPGIVRGVFGSDGFTLSTGFRFSSGVTDLSDLRFIGGSVDVRAHYRAGDGAVFVDTPLVNVGLLIHAGETSTHLFVTRDWYARTLGARPSTRGRGGPA